MSADVALIHLPYSATTSSRKWSAAFRHKKPRLSHGTAAMTVTPMKSATR